MWVKLHIATLALLFVIAGCNTKKAGTDTGGGRFSGQADLNQKIQGNAQSSSSGQGGSAAQPHQPPDASKRQEAAGMNQKKPAQVNQKPERVTKGNDASKGGETRH
jgi:hypothetical protein